MLRPQAPIRPGRANPFAVIGFSPYRAGIPGPLVSPLRDRIGLRPARMGGALDWEQASPRGSSEVAASIQCRAAELAGARVP